jgi:hypothetical protein
MQFREHRYLNLKFLDLWKDSEPRIAELENARKKLLGLKNRRFLMLPILRTMGGNMNIVRITLIVIIVVSYCFFITGCGKEEAPEASEASKPPEAPPEHSGVQLELVTFKWMMDGDTGIVEGEVKNISSNPLNDVFTVVRFLDEDGVEIASAEAGIDSSELAAGETSAFITLAQFEGPEVKDVTLEFKIFGGAVIPHVHRE